ncbi:uncharacterized protein LOC126470983 [Schistocerca serialis cubense]|uniref:uncharacterized protein LOC126470983 n=1 Tax=Schistocerca serialis cubense TaxID=2023355 RepID=UPI00214EF723|nr:uncharacterized protein LOC126470983 [Schistocerca serialis cubense]
MKQQKRLKCIIYTSEAESKMCWIDCFQAPPSMNQVLSKVEDMRHLKKAGSKIDGKCPAEMKVLYKEKKCLVNFVSTHAGYYLDLSHLNVTPQEHSCRHCLQDSNSERVYLATLQDLHNTRASYNLASKSVRHQHDAIRVEAWVQEVQESDNACVLFYKPQEIITNQHAKLRSEDFMLVIMNTAQDELLAKYGNDYICVDGTGGLNAYDFELTTILVLADKRQEYPCAFLISNRDDSDVLNIFFNYIKSQNPTVSLGMEQLGLLQRDLNGTWHVNRAWTNNINSKVLHKDQRTEVYKLVKTLIQVRDVAIFEESLQKALQKLYSDTDTSKFSYYLRTYYEKYVNCWAYCHMQAGLNTNMHLESMHKALKYVHANAKQVKRLDKGISALMSFVTTKLFDGLTVIMRGKVTITIKYICARHKSVLMDDFITKVDSGWEVPSSKSNDIFLVKDNDIHCKCKLVCSKCEVHIHQYSCTCIDYNIKLNVCKYIHIVCQTEKKSRGEIPWQNHVLSDALVVDAEDLSATDEREASWAQESTNSSCNNPEALSDEKKKTVSMFPEVIAGMSTAKVKLAKNWR